MLKKTNGSKFPFSLRLFCAAFAVFFLCTSFLFSEDTKAKNNFLTDEANRIFHKISPEINEHLQNQDSQLAETGNPDHNNLVKIIVQFDDNKYKDQARARISAFFQSNGIKIKSELNNLHIKVIEMPLQAVKELASFDAISFISFDKETEFLGHIETTTGAAAMRAQSGNSTIDGRGIGIAVLDSGLYGSHRSFQGSDGNSRLVAQADFTGEGITTEDPYGHGSHVAGIAAGGTRNIPTTYKGIAPEARLINLRVLDLQGRGTSSMLLSALDWILTNRTTYNIRVVNMSLGTLAVDS
jgi:serine protease AprX